MTEPPLEKQESPPIGAGFSLCEVRPITEHPQQLVSSLPVHHFRYSPTGWQSPAPLSWKPDAHSHAKLPGVLTQTVRVPQRPAFVAHSSMSARRHTNAHMQTCITHLRTHARTQIKTFASLF